MMDNINELLVKYYKERIVWNLANPIQPQNYDQNYLSTERFMQCQGAVLIVKNSNKYSHYLTQEEDAFIKSMLNSANAL